MILVEARRQRVLLVDDHAVLREGVRALLGREADLLVVGEAQNRDEALEAVRALHPDVALLDVSLGRDNGLALIPELRAHAPSLKVLVLSMHDEAVFAERALQQGANGYIMKDQSVVELLAALRKVLAGRMYVSGAVSERLLLARSEDPGRRDRNGLERLSDRELEVLLMIGQGAPPRTISQRLGIAPKTVETHRARIKSKLGLETAAELMIVAVNWLRDGFLERR